MVNLKKICPHSSMDRVSLCGREDGCSNQPGGTKNHWLYPMVFYLQNFSK